MKEPAFRRSPVAVSSRAVQKHGDRPGSVYPRVGSPAERSRIGEELVEDYLKNPNVRERVRDDGVRIFELPDGRGVSFEPDGSFRGLLEPRP
jgi:filamentous hemagglutinin